MKVILLSIIAIGMIGLVVPNAFAQLHEDPVTDYYIYLLILIFVTVIPAIYAANKKSKKDSKKAPQTKLTDLEFQPDTKFVCPKCSFETDDQYTFETHNDTKDGECIKSWAGTTFYNGKWGETRNNTYDVPVKPHPTETNIKDLHDLKGQNNTLEQDGTKEIEGTKFHREPKSDTTICRNCNKENPNSHNFCAYCGNNLS